MHAGSTDKVVCTLLIGIQFQADGSGGCFPSQADQCVVVLASWMLWALAHFSLSPPRHSLQILVANQKADCGKSFRGEEGLQVLNAYTHRLV